MICDSLPRGCISCMSLLPPASCQEDCLEEVPRRSGAAGRQSGTCWLRGHVWQDDSPTLRHTTFSHQDILTPLLLTPRHYDYEIFWHPDILTTRHFATQTLCHPDIVPLHTNQDILTPRHFATKTFCHSSYFDTQTFCNQSYILLHHLSQLS